MPHPEWIFRQHFIAVQKLKAHWHDYRVWISGLPHDAALFWAESRGGQPSEPCSKVCLSEHSCLICRESDPSKVALSRGPVAVITFESLSSGVSCCSGGSVYIPYYSTSEHAFPGVVGLHDLMVFFSPMDEARFSDDMIQQFKLAWAEALGPVLEQGNAILSSAALSELAEGFSTARMTEGWREVTVPWIQPRAAKYTQNWQFLNLGINRGFIVCLDLVRVPLSMSITFGKLSTDGHLLVAKEAAHSIFVLPPQPS